MNETDGNQNRKNGAFRLRSLQRERLARFFFAADLVVIATSGDVCTF
ncbi:hypothetical protein ACFQY3_00925 [Paenibacillus farraposensis]